MKTAALLDTDLTTVRRWLGAGLQWWVGELVALVPERLTRGSGSRPVASLDGDSFTLMARNGTASVTVPGRSAMKVDLALSAADVLVRRVTVPNLPRRDIAAMLMLNIGRLTPFEAEQVFAEVRFDAADPGQAWLAVVRKTTATRLLEQALNAGLKPQRLGIAEDGLPTFDFLPKLGGVGRRRRGTVNTILWSLVGGLAAANILAAIILDSRDIAGLSARVDGQRPLVTIANGIRARTESTDARRRQLLADRRQREPLTVLDGATRALPDTAWVQHYTSDGRSVRLTGIARDGVDVLVGLRHEPLFVDARNIGGDQPVPLATGKSFDVTADLAAGRRR